jgi:hypothetical protein
MRMSDPGYCSICGGALNNIDIQNDLSGHGNLWDCVHNLEAANKRLLDFRSGHGMPSEADGPEEATLLVIGLHERAEAAEQDSDHLGNALADMLWLIEEHGDRVMQAHATRIMKARTALINHEALRPGAGRAGK